MDGEKEFQEWELEESESDGLLGNGYFESHNGRSGKMGWPAEDMFKDNERMGVESSFIEDSPQYST